MGLVIVNTGDGKGKTTAALGAAMRIIGHGGRVLFLQFMKQRDSGELKAANRLPQLEIRQFGTGFIEPVKGASERDKDAARRGLDAARQAMLSDSYDMLVLDEINCAVELGLLHISSVIELVEMRPPRLHILLTGRDAPEEVIRLADTVTYAKEIKHPFRKGITARKGIEF